jgi:hypothetical protein
MILRSTRFALLLGALSVGACQTGYYQSSAPPPMPTASTPMDGVWASTDGVFVATFQQGSFTSRFTATNEILAQGRYTVAGNTVVMQWISVATQQQRSANCTIGSGESVTCNQQGGGHFELRRAGVESQAAAAPAPPPASAPAPATAAPPPAPVQ